MRNLKRALSLGLASVMLLGMMVVGAGAKGIDDYKDKDQIVNKDAVGVTSSIGIFAGYDDGTFGGSKVVTRAEMAVIICKILYGADVSVDQFAENNVFTDVPAWAAGYVNLCASLNIVAGVGDNRYDPSSTVTTAQAALMLAKALGYFQNEADYGNNWMLASTAKGTQIGLYSNLSGLSATAGLTRNDVAVMTFNALTKAVPVAYNDVFGVYYSERGNLTAGVVFNYLDTLAFRNFDLVYMTKEDADDFGRPGTVWGIGSVRTGNSTDEKGNLVSSFVNLLVKNEIVTVAKAADYVYTTGTKMGPIFRALGSDLVRNGTFTYFDNGRSATFAALANDNDTTWNGTRNGSTTEIYVDDMDVTVVRTNYYFTEVDRVRSDSKGTYITVNSIAGVAVNNRDFYVEGFQAGDWVVVTVGYDGKDVIICSAVAPETTEGKVNAISTANSSLNLDGVKYNYNVAMSALVAVDDKDSNPILDDEYTLYLDPNGCVVGYERLDEGTVKYAYVKSTSSSLGDYRARLVFADGSEEVVDISDSSKINGVALDSATAPNVNGFDKRAVSYTVNSKGVYTLTLVSSTTQTTTGYTITKETRTFTGPGATGSFTDSTVFVDIKNDRVYTGYKNVPTYANATLTFALKGTSSQVAAVFITDGVPSGDKTFFYLTGDDATTQIYDGVRYTVYQKAYIDGNLVTDNGGLWVLETVAATFPGANSLGKGVSKGLYEVDQIASGIYVKAAHTWIGTPTVLVTEKDDSYFVAGGQDYIFETSGDDKTVFVRVEIVGTTYTVSPGSSSDLKENKSNIIIAAFDPADFTAQVVYIFT